MIEVATLSDKEGVNMAVDFPEASAHFLPEHYCFATNAASAIVIHKTGGDGTLDSLYNTFFQSMRSTHYGIDLDGAIWQFVPEARGAGGNCCTEVGYNPFWNPYKNQHGNLNLCTLSVEHCDPTSDNSHPMPQAQIDTSFKLVQYWCQKYHIGIDHIHSHASIDPINRARCPGPTYDFQALFRFLQAGGTMSGIPTGWHDDGTTLSAPNGQKVVLGFREFLLTHPWDAADMPLEAEVWLDPLEESNPSLGAGSQQIFTRTVLEYTKASGVFVAHIGQEFQFVREERNEMRKRLAATQQQLATLQAGLATADMNKLTMSIAQLQRALSAPMH